MWLFMYTIDIKYTYWKRMNDIQDMFNSQGGFPTSDIRGQMTEERQEDWGAIGGGLGGASIRSGGSMDGRGCEK